MRICNHPNARSPSRSATHSRAARKEHRLTGDRERAIPPLECIELRAERQLRLADLWAIAADGASLALSEEIRARMRASEGVLTRHLAAGRRVYGVTTGYGPQVRHAVDPERASQLQRNLIFHLATGVGAPLSARATRAMMTARIANLARGHSAIGWNVVALVLACLDADVLPVVPEMGTVGASGDLTPLAHLGLMLLGEGSATFAGETLPANVALTRAGLEPLEFGGKDGLALVNGTAAMTGIAALNATSARRLWEFALRLGALYAETLGGRGEAFDPRLGIARPHPGQIFAHARLEQILAGSSRLRPADALSTGGDDERELLQDPYSIRCLPQIFGAAHDVLAFHDGIVATELNSATDNPLVFAADDEIVHGGNFFGQPVAYASDALACAVINIAVHAERAIARLCDPQQNRGLPAFLHAAPSGLNSGYMGAQVTATALVAEMRTLALPASIQSIPTNANNQDVVPMGTIAARKTARLLELAWLVLAIEAMMLADGVELRLKETDADARLFAHESRSLVTWIRSMIEPLNEDRSLSVEISTLARTLERDADSAVGTPSSRSSAQNDSPDSLQMLASKVRT